MNNSMAIVILSFDGYSDLWDPCLSLLKRFWPDNKYPIYLVTNNAHPDFEGVRVINVGDEISWSNRARKAISQVQEDYILLLLEDYFLGGKVNSVQVSRLLEHTIINDIDYLRVVPIPKTRYKDGGANGLHVMSEDTLYGINLQAAIWKKSFFLKTLSVEDYSAWEYEKRQKIDSPYRTKGKCYVMDYWALNILNGVIQGQWYGATLKYFGKIGINIELGDRAIMSQKKVITLNFKRLLNRIVPVVAQKKLKPLLEKMGFKFVT
jgi:hypothetical protein